MPRWDFSYVESIQARSGQKSRDSLEEEDFDDPGLGDPTQNSQSPLGDLLQSTLKTRERLQKVALTLTAGQTWYGFPVKDVDAHMADYMRCLLNGGLGWSLRKDAFVSEQPFEDKIQEFPSKEDRNVLKYLVQCWDLESRVKNGDGGRFLDAVATMCSRRKRFTTSHGMVGIGPETMEENDIVCILYGAEVPFIIRPRNEGPGYVLVGECYIQELMSEHGGNQVQREDQAWYKMTEAKEAWIELH
ncbi:hypothetical protein N656DRAFT_518294 [Canariomyces notabilis]|uniref:Uncharacterized protein n=1 Tax=Canariomyces notabilis TaxID=2074819 RepID=A0AAN6QEF3_9PEZI|nr:hypothetical protein N656DRAFT_518294 [Canariomyces arenarius]